MKPPKIQNDHQGAQKSPVGSGKGSTDRFLGTPVNFRKIGFLNWALLLWEKYAAEKTGKNKARNSRHKRNRWSWVKDEGGMDIWTLIDLPLK